MVDCEFFQKVSISASHFKCFDQNGAMIDNILPINFVIGRNNSGKSSLIDLIRLCIEKNKFYDAQRHSRSGRDTTFYITQPLLETDLTSALPASRSGGPIQGSHAGYRQKIIGRPITRQFSPPFKTSAITTSNLDLNEIKAEKFREQLQKEIGNNTAYPFDNLQFIKISAERKVSPEHKSTDYTIQKDGSGTTNAIRAFITHQDLPTDLVEKTLLSHLNTIYDGDSKFNRILIREDGSDRWEIFLEDEENREIRLSESGSSLQSIFIILSFLTLTDNTAPYKIEKSILSIEEPENNLHPSLLRKLLDFLNEQQKKMSFIIFISTHSPVCIDWCTKNENSQIIHVKNQDGCSTAATSASYMENKDILDDLDIRASDILQANGIIWVEGPSDRIYIRHWINILSQNSLKEGSHYSIMFYGGKLLSHLEARPYDEISNLISLLKINRNVAVVIDSDRNPTPKTNSRKPRININRTKQRIRDEIKKHNGYCWITDGKEIENYLPNSLLSKILKDKSIDFGPYDEIPSDTRLGRMKNKKIEFSHFVCDYFNEEHMKSNQNLLKEVSGLISHIQKWNKS